MTFLANNYNRKKISFKKGVGSYLVATNGKKYLDFCSGIAVNSLGHANPRLVKALYKQAKRVWHVSNAFTIPEGEMLAKKLVKKTFADSVIFQNSGTEATEVAIKVARRYFYSIDRLPEILQKISFLNPFFHMIDGLRFSFIGSSDGSIKFGLIYLFLLSLIIWFISFLLYKKGYKIRN